MKVTHIITLALTSLYFTYPALAIDYTKGCLAKIYVIDKWPIDKLPDGPNEIVEYQSTIEIKAVSQSPENNNLPNVLVAGKYGILQGKTSYAVEFEGFFKSSEEGLYTFALDSDDPTELYIEGNKVAESDFEIKNDRYTKIIKGSASATVKLGKEKYYHIVILAKQKWDPDVYSVYGAHLVFTYTRPNGESGLTPLYLHKSMKP